MPACLEPGTRAAASSDSDSDGPRKDEYGDLFEDYGFLRRAEEFKAQGNADFKHERYQEALQEYEEALEQLLTVAYDKSVVLGKQKWNDVIVLRSTIRLNRSACYYKLRSWKRANEEALECLVGNVREEMMLTDSQVREKVRRYERQRGEACGILVEDRLPRITRAKAWFRVCQSYAQLEYLDRAREAFARALEVCDDETLHLEISKYEERIESLERRQMQRQKKQFAGFFEKLREEGGAAGEGLEGPQSAEALGGGGGGAPLPWHGASLQPRDQALAATSRPSPEEEAPLRWRLAEDDEVAAEGESPSQVGPVPRPSQGYAQAWAQAGERGREERRRKDEDLQELKQQRLARQARVAELETLDDSSGTELGGDMEE